MVFFTKGGISKNFNKMSKLHSVENTELSDYCVNVLAKHDILLVGDLVRESSDKLMKILNINAEQVDKIKLALKRLYGPVYKTFADLHQEFCYATNIGPLDDVLGHCALTNHSVWEICGPSGVGKTQLAFTLATNFVQLYHSEVLYIDTKLDFSARRVKNILNSRQLQAEVVAGCLQAIKLERVHSAQAVVELLEALWQELHKGNDHVRNIKCIVVDSLPSVWFLLKAESNRLAGRWLLSRLANLAYRLSEEYQICLIFVNLSVIPSAEQAKEEGPNNACIEEEDEISKSLLDDEKDAVDTAGKSSTYRQIMGQFWSSKPHVRLSMEFISDTYKATRSPRRIIKVLHSSIESFTPSCNVRLCEQGVV